MPQDNDQLLVSVKGQIKDFQRAMASVESRVKQTERKIDKEMGGVARSSTRAARTMEREFSTATARIDQKVAASFAKFRGGAGAGLGAVGVTTGLGALGAFSAGSIISEVNRAASSIADLNAEAERAGLTFQQFQELKFAFGRERVSIDALTDGFKELQLRADEFITTGKGSAEESFKRLGYGADSLAEKLKNPVDLLFDIIDRAQELDRAAQIRIFDELLGGTGGEQFVQLLDAGSDKLRQSIARAHELGAILSDETAAKAIEVDRRFQEIAATVEKIAKENLVEVADALNRILTTAGGINSAIQSWRKSAEDFVGSFGQIGDFLVRLNRWEFHWGLLDSVEGMVGSPSNPLQVPEVSAPAGGLSNTTGLNDSFASSLRALAAAAREAGHEIRVNSGFRSVERQKELFDAAVRKYGSEAAARKWVAPPGRSNHNFGLAADLGFGSDAARRFAHENAGRFGLSFPMGHEPWHVEPTGPDGGRIRGGNAMPQPADRREITAQAEQERLKLLEQQEEARKRQKEAIDAVNQSLAEELEMAGLEKELLESGKFTLDEVNAALDQESLVREKLNQLQQAGVPITAELEARIRAQVAALFELRDASDQAIDAQQRLQDRTQELQGAFQGIGQPIVDTFLSIVDGSAKAEDALKRLALQLANMVLQGALFGQGPLGGLFGGGLLGGLFGGVPGRAIGGPVSAGQPYMVGERGPELFVPNGAGRIMTAGQTAAAMARSGQPLGGGGVTAPIQIVLSSRFLADGGFETAVERTSRPIARVEARNASERVAKAVPGIVDQRNEEKRTRRIRPQSGGS